MNANKSEMSQHEDTDMGDYTITKNSAWRYQMYLAKIIYFFTSAMSHEPLTVQVHYHRCRHVC